jgi:hypothetical protein
MVEPFSAVVSTRCQPANELHDVTASAQDDEDDEDNGKRPGEANYQPMQQPVGQLPTVPHP